ncbi:MAG: CBS domain-containing protein [Alphaproteobacteria bacterium]|nr:CBS domain-containing protein [Alphaproteobacteria bacterium]
MTADVAVVSPDTPTPAIARLLLDRGVSAVPVIDNTGAPVGIVSEGDLIGRGESEREARRDWWLALMAEGEPLSPDFIASLRQREQTARDIMAAPVVTVDETADVAEIARLLTTYRIKRVPVVHDGRIVGIVSRADLLRALAGEAQHAAEAERHPAAHGLLAEAVERLDERFLGHGHAKAAAVNGRAAPAAGGRRPSAADFRALVVDFEHQQAIHGDETRRALAERRRRAIGEIINHHVADEYWRTLLHRARTAAEHGGREAMLMRFPSDACSDGGRAINALEPDWPATLRGEAAELYLRWEHELRPRGFGLSARVLDYPGGMPGDVGLFLSWSA